MGKLRLILKAFEDKRVGFINDGGVETGEVDLGCGFRVVAHAFADYRQRYALCFSCGCPAVAGNVEGQRDCDADHSGYGFQVVVDVIAYVAVGASLVGAGITDDGQQVFAFVLGVLVKNHLHFLSPFDDELLIGLATAVGDISVFEVSFFQKCHIDKTHSPEIKAHKKHIAGVVQ